MIKTLINIFHALIQSHMIYCILLWGNLSLIKKIYILQEKAMRIIANKKVFEQWHPLFMEYIFTFLLDINRNENIISTGNMMRTLQAPEIY